MPKEIPISKEYLEQKYIKEGFTTVEIARLVGCTPNTISYKLKKYGIPIRENVQKKREESPYWKGGKYKDRLGYVFVYVPDHPQAHSTGYYLEHRLIMEKHLGRYLDPETEHVHHKNGDPSDNRLENLVLLTKSKHHKEHHDKRRRADSTYKEIISLYQKGYSRAEVAQLTGKDKVTVHAHIKRAGIARNLSDAHKAKWQKIKEKQENPELERAMKLYEHGLSGREVARIIGKNPATVRYWLRKAGVIRDSGEAKKLWWKRYWEEKEQR